MGWRGGGRSGAGWRDHVQYWMIYPMDHDFFCLWTGMGWIYGVQPCISMFVLSSTLDIPENLEYALGSTIIFLGSSI